MEKLAEGRDILKRALEADLARLSESKAEIDGIAALHVSRLSEGRELLKQALQADLEQLAESRSGIDGLVAAQVEKLTEGRDILRRALEADLIKLSRKQGRNRKPRRHACAEAGRRPRNPEACPRGRFGSTR